MSQLGRPLEPQVCACPLSFGEGMYSTWEHALSTATLPIAGVQAKPEAVSYCAGWDTSADQGHGDSQHWASEMQTHCCPKAPRIPTAATTAAVWMRSWSSRMPVGGSCHGAHALLQGVSIMLPARRQPPCSPALPVPMCVVLSVHRAPWGWHRRGQGGIGVGGHFPEAQPLFGWALSRRRQPRSLCPASEQVWPASALMAASRAPGLPWSWLCFPSARPLALGPSHGEALLEPQGSMPDNSHCAGEGMPGKRKGIEQWSWDGRGRAGAGRQ